MIKYIKYHFLIIILTVSAYSQAPIGNLTSIEINKNKDTLLIKRSYGNWWFGAFTGRNFNVYYGNLNVNRNLFEKDNPFYVNVSYNGGSGSGYHIGGMAEYQPPGDKWGYSLKIAFLDTRNSQTFSSDENYNSSKPDTFNTTYQAFADLNYITISPSVRYNFLWEGFHLFSGLDIEINYNAESRNIKEFYNPEFIREKSKLNFKDINTRIGAHVGLGYDIFMINYNNRMRIRLTPYVSMSYGTTVISDNNSSWNTLLARVGFQLKLGPDKTEIDTIKYNPEWQPQPEYIASAMSERGIEFPDYVYAEPLPAAKISVVQIEYEDLTILGKDSTNFARNIDTTDIATIQPPEPIEDEIIEETQEPVETEVTEEPEEDIAINVPPETLPDITIEPNTTRTLNFPGGSANTQLSEENRRYLDELARFMENNPGVEIRVVGYSDDQGTLIQNTQRSIARANAVRDYLMNKGIPFGSILANGVGALNPVATNATPEGRAQNRRVEITIVQ